jgi:hypothetical protein
MELWSRSRSIWKMASSLCTIVENVKDVACFEKYSRHQ